MVNQKTGTFYNWSALTSVAHKGRQEPCKRPAKLGLSRSIREYLALFSRPMAASSVKLWRSTLVKTHGRWLKETWQFWLWPTPLAFAFGRQPAFESLHLSIYMQVAKEFDTVLLSAWSMTSRDIFEIPSDGFNAESLNA